jgi:hypothetical protein
MLSEFIEFLSLFVLHRAAQFWRRLMRVEIRISPILKDPPSPRESNGCWSCRATEDSDPLLTICFKKRERHQWWIAMKVKQKEKNGW